MTVSLVVAVVAVLLVAAFAYGKYRHNYWPSRGVPIAPGALPYLGHLLKFFNKKKRLWIYMDELYHDGADKFMGMYDLLKPRLIIGEPERVKAVCVKDFEHFVDRNNIKFTTERDEIFNEVLTAATGDHWKGIRSVLSPTFTSGRLKGMFPLVEAKADALVAYLNQKIKTNPSQNIKRTFGIYTLEVISSCAFGMETNTLSDGDSLFHKKVESMTKFTSSQMLKFFLYTIAPWLFRVLKINLSQPEVTFFKEVVEETIKDRENGSRRGDFLDLMLEARKDQEKPTEKTPKYPLTNKTVVANAILFIMAGYDTTSSTLSFVSFVLARYQNYQKQVRQELLDIIKENGTLTYQGVMEAKMLEAVFSETLRLYPLAYMIERLCTRDYKFQDTNITVSKGISVRIPVWSLHHDPRYWHHPGTFIPERFLPENKDKIIPGTYLPFGIGPRNCVGMRFAQMEAKLAVAKIILNFEIHCPPGGEELRYDRHMGMMRPASDTNLIFTPLDK